MKRPPLHIEGSEDDSLTLLRAWDNLCRSAGCSAEQLRELHWLPRGVPAEPLSVEVMISSPEWELEDLQMWIGQWPPERLN